MSGCLQNRLDIRYNSMEEKKPLWKKLPLVFQHSGILDRENFADSNCRLPLEMIIFEGKSVQNTSRKLGKIRLRRLLTIVWRKNDIILVLGHPKWKFMSASHQIITFCWDAKSCVSNFHLQTTIIVVYHHKFPFITVLASQISIYNSIYKHCYGVSNFHLQSFLCSVSNFHLQMS